MCYNNYYGFPPGLFFRWAAVVSLCGPLGKTTVLIAHLQQKQFGFLHTRSCSKRVGTWLCQAGLTSGSIGRCNSLPPQPPQCTHAKLFGSITDPFGLADEPNFRQWYFGDEYTARSQVSSHSAKGQRDFCLRSIYLVSIKACVSSFQLGGVLGKNNSSA